MRGKKENAVPRSVLDRLHEWESTRFSQKPHSMMLTLILCVNVILVLLSAWVISAVAMHGNENTSFFAAVYNTFTMILDAGCIESVISDPGSANIFLIIFCLVIIVICMITFTGALIGYATNVVSSMIENANANSIKLKISGHVAVLGWNTRAPEIINDLLYCRDRQKVVVLSDGDREAILEEITERLNDTVRRENAELEESVRQMPWLKKMIYLYRHKLRNNMTVIVREGDVFSAVHLNNIQLDRARSIIILGRDMRSAVHEGADTEAESEKGDSRTVKTLIQAVNIASNVLSADNQKVVVEIENEWTADLVEKIMRAKLNLDKCRVVPFRVHTVMGQLLSQFSLMPELNKVYSSLFSNKGTSFYARPQAYPDNHFDFSEDYLNTHRRALPLLFIKDEMTREVYFYYMADNEKDIDAASPRAEGTCALSLNRNYWLPEKHVLILGSNSKIANVMDGYASFCKEWTSPEHPRIVHITAVDEEETLRKANYYRNYPFVDECMPARIIERQKITDIIRNFVYAHPQNSSILILSDDTVPDDDIDAKMMTFLIYAKDVISRARVNKRDVSFNVDIIAEVLDPRHVDLVRGYDVDNVIISNRYISKMVTQISEDFARYSLYEDIMNYDEMDSAEYDGIEIYIKKAGEYFDELPPKNTSVDTVIRSVYEASRRFWGSDLDFAMLLGYIDTRGRVTLFGGARDQQTVTLTAEDKLIVFSNH